MFSVTGYLLYKRKMLSINSLCLAEGVFHYWHKSFSGMAVVSYRTKWFNNNELSQVLELAIKIWRIMLKILLSKSVNIQSKFAHK